MDFITTPFLQVMDQFSTPKKMHIRYKKCLPVLIKCTLLVIQAALDSPEGVVAEPHWFVDRRDVVYPASHLP